jgi:2-polyprenyl-3-methyl-5-hydroxy-6-metoxy-1,4-benzoquinol methylase
MKHSHRREQKWLDVPELIDQGPSVYSQEEYEECLKCLAKAGAQLGGNRALFSALQELQPPPTSFLDIGCGGGEFVCMLAQRYPQAHILGIDIDALAIEHAQQLVEQCKKNISLPSSVEGCVNFAQKSFLDLDDTPNAFEVVLATLVCHHLNDEQLIDFLKKSVRIARRAVILSDLHCHWLARIGFNGIAALFYRNRLFQHDGELSIRKGFTRENWEAYLQAAGVTPAQYRISWHWPFRWVVRILTS